MTYLDPQHTETASDMGRWVMWLIVVLGVIAFSYFVLTLDNGRGAPASLESARAASVLTF